MCKKITHTPTGVSAIDFCDNIYKYVIFFFFGKNIASKMKTANLAFTRPDIEIKVVRSDFKRKVSALKMLMMMMMMRLHMKGDKRM